MANQNRFTLVMGTKTYSSWSIRPWLTLRIVTKSASSTFTEIVLPVAGAGSFNPAYDAAIRRYSPSGKVPLLQDNVTGIYVWDSLAISEYLAEVFPQERLWPVDAKARAFARAICAEMHAGFTALRSAMPMHLKKKLAPGEFQVFF